MHFVAVSPDFIFSAGADFINVAALDTLHSRCIMCCIDTSKEWDLRMHTAKRHGMQELSVQHRRGSEGCVRTLVLRYQDAAREDIAVGMVDVEGKVMEHETYVLRRG